MRIILKNINCLTTCNSNDIKDAAIISNGFLVLEEGIIKKVGSDEGYKSFIEEDSLIIDGYGKTVTPGLIDCHTHVVYGGSREHELELKLNNVGYIEILKNGGGILSTVNETRRLNESELYLQAQSRLDKMLLHGTTTIESKSGYGLNLFDEIKMLNVNRQLNEKHAIDVVSTFMGAHALPSEFKEDKGSYIKLIIDKMIPMVAQEKLAEFIDVFCEEGVFSVEETRRILLAGRKYGLKLKLHADEIHSIGGAELAAELSALSAEHLVGASHKGILEMKERNVIPVLLPATSFYLRLNKYADAREMIDKGLNIALATDCNPGTCPTESLQIGRAHV